MTMDASGSFPISLLLATLAASSCGGPPSPKPSDPDDWEMGVAAAPSARAKVDPRVLARFDVEYRRASGASRPVFDEYLPILGSAALLDYLEGKFPSATTRATISAGRSTPFARMSAPACASAARAAPRPACTESWERPSGRPLQQCRSVWPAHEAASG